MADGLGARAWCGLSGIEPVRGGGFRAAGGVKAGGAPTAAAGGGGAGAGAGGGVVSGSGGVHGVGGGGGGGGRDRGGGGSGAGVVGVGADLVDERERGAVEFGGGGGHGGGGHGDGGYAGAVGRADDGAVRGVLGDHHRGSEQRRDVRVGGAV